MKKILSISSFLFFLLQINSASALSIASSTIFAGKTMPLSTVFNGFGCNGENKSPNLSWSNAPIGTKSFAITVYDPDAPTGSGWWHWTVFNIPATISEIATNASAEQKLPQGAIEGRTDFGKSSYGGACPPIGDKPHRYIFTIHALKVDKIDLDSSASGALVGFYINKNTIEKASITSIYSR